MHSTCTECQAGVHGQLCLSHGNRFVCKGDCRKDLATYVDEDGSCSTCGADTEVRIEPGPCGCLASVAATQPQQAQADSAGSVAS